MNMKHGHRVIPNLKGMNINKDVKAQKYLQEQVVKLIKDLKIK
jgi:hypothetical protein